MARLIDADALVENIGNEINKKTKVILLADYNHYYCSGMRNAIRLVKRLPTVDPVKHGHWIHSSSTEYLTVSCSECGYKVNYFWDSWQDALYCPKCGARMDAVDK